MFSTILKFNPNHDPKTGKFTNHAGQAIPKPAKTALHAMLDRVAAPDGGFTYQPTTQREPTEGYALSLHPEKSFAKPAKDFRFKDLVDYFLKNAEDFQNPDNFIGAWHDPESHMVFLDVSTVKAKESEAAALALQHDQIAYFDLKNLKSVTVNPDAKSGILKEAYGHQTSTTFIDGQSEVGRISQAIQGIDRARSDRAGISRGETSVGRAFAAVLKFNPHHDSQNGQFTSGLTESANRSRDGSPRGISLREHQADALPVQAVTHYSHAAGLTTLSAAKYGSGIRGAEAARLAQSTDINITNRVYFYLNPADGKLPPKEGGLGNHVYQVELGNLYDLATDPKQIRNTIKDIADPADRANRMESLIVQHGYDGYAVKAYNMAVVLGKDVPVKEIKQATDCPLGQVLKFNPHHDPKTGQFASGSTSYTDIHALHTALRAMRQQPDQHPNILQTEVAGKKIFANGESLGILRKDMPQIPAPLYKEFLQTLGVKTHNEAVSPLKIKPTQSELDGFKVGKLYHDVQHGKKSKAILVSSDNYILDGHHHWAAQVVRAQSHKKTKVDIERIAMPIQELLMHAKNFDHSHHIDSKDISKGEYANILKFNPYHDDDGKFCSKDRAVQPGHKLMPTVSAVAHALAKVGHNRFAAAVEAHMKGKEHYSPVAQAHEVERVARQIIAQKEDAAIDCQLAAVLKFNPHHDSKNGQFSSGDGGGSGDYVEMTQEGSSNNTDDSYQKWKKIQFAVDAQAQKWTKATHAEWDTLTKDEKSAVAAYTGGLSSGLNKMSGLAEGDTLSFIAGGTDLDQQHYQKVYHDLDAALPKMSAPENMRLYRSGSISRAGGAFAGINGESSIEDLQKLVGQTYTEKSFSSTTGRLSIATGFFSNSDTRIYQELEIPKGTKGAWVGSNDRSEHPGEQEFIMPRNTRWIVTGAYQRPHPRASYDEDYQDRTINVLKLRPVFDSATKFENVLKFNPFHDKAGRFASHGGANYISTGPKLAKTLARLKSQLAEQEKAVVAETYTEMIQTSPSYGSLSTEEYTKQVGELKAAIKDQAQKWVDATKDQWSSLSDGEKSAIDDYTRDYSIELNTMSGLANGEELTYIPGQNEEYKARAIKRYHNLDTALAKMEAPENMRLFRMGTMSRAGGAFANITRSTPLEDLQKLVGQTYTEKSFASTTALLSLASGFSNHSRVYQELEIPKGTKGAWVGGSGRGSHPSEQEFLLPRNMKWIVTDAYQRPHPLAEADDSYKDDTITVLKMKPIPDERKA